MFLFAFLEQPDELKEKWEAFLTGTLAETNKRNTVELVSAILILFFFFLKIYLDILLLTLSIRVCHLSTKGVSDLLSSGL
jgi:hypothetical protein